MIWNPWREIARLREKIVLLVCEVERQRVLKEIHFADAERERLVRKRAAKIASDAAHAANRARKAAKTAALKACRP